MNTAVREIADMLAAEQKKRDSEKIPWKEIVRLASRLGDE
jgi:hypothetical protein